MARLTNNDFVTRAVKKHGGKYDYSLVEYVNSNTKVKIVCKDHGVFDQLPLNHTSGSGCPKCSFLKTSKQQKLTTDDFVQRSIKKHGKTYDYSLVDYVNNNTKVKIVCKDHGVFKQSPASHLNGHGCPKCGVVTRVNKQSHTVNSFVDKANHVHDNRYDYSLVEYTKSHNSVIIICPEHGKFSQLAYNHLNGNGCPKCGVLSQVDKQSSTLSDFVSKSNEIHNTQYDYSLVDYVNSKTKVKIICNRCNDEFLQTPSDHILGSGCPVCNSGRFNHDKPAIIYVHKVLKYGKLVAYKYGISNVSSKYRSKSQNRLSASFIEIVPYLEYNGTGTQVFAIERNITKKFNTKVMRKEEMQDGYTETVSYNDGDDLVSFIENEIYYGEKHDNNIRPKRKNLGTKVQATIY